MNPHELSWQPSLLEAGQPALDPAFGTLVRVDLDGDSWVDHAPGWVRGADPLFAQVVDNVAWTQRERWMYGRRLPEPRLTGRWTTGEPPVAMVEQMRDLLSERYRVPFDSVGFNLYRDGRDSVAWHRDRIPEGIAEPVVALVSLGDSRGFRLRPLERRPPEQPGEATFTFHLGRGDLLVTGGRAQRAWEHSVPKVKSAGPRVSLAFRHGVRYD